ncbi:archaeosortase/exosortase family protein [Sediminitomix flava]|uniref:archaeosortase/exosortase family protein n=1 Tax=Sediminitomix flava TaxID=379075 RepID=UPI00130496F7|nr:archaeosortase/exosortase family protein [Sediminitomix flava]
MLYLLWQTTYIFWLKPAGHLDIWLTESVAVSSVYLLQLFGYDAYGVKNQVFLNQIPAVWIGHACNGLSLMVLFLGFIGSSPGKIISKVSYGLIGVLLIYASNALRVMILAINYVKSPLTFDFNHKYTYAIAVYLIIFCMWMIWTNYFSGVKINQQATTV